MYNDRGSASPMVSEMKRVTVPGHLDGARVDVVLARLAGVSRSRARRLIDSGEAGRGSAEAETSLRPKHRMSEGEVVWFRPEIPAPVRACQMQLDILYEDRYLAVVNKPAGMVVHPAPGNQEGTLVSALLGRWPRVEGVGEYPRWGIVHRLDKDTSGAIVVALEAETHRLLTAALAARQVGRRYLALVHGAFPVTTGTIDAPIDRRRARRYVAAGGKPAVTHYRRLASWSRPSLSLLEVTLDTGRTHQIRVHMESIGRHLVGDRMYGKPGPPAIDPGRGWLHARRLALAHPIEEGEEVVASAPLPGELASSRAALGPPETGAIPGESGGS